MTTSTVKQRLAELKDQLKLGREQLDMLEQKRAEVEGTMLRISGAIQVLEELLGSENGVEHSAAA
jgi:prefoldin subunit 5